MTQQPTDNAALIEVRRLLAERAAKKRELDAIDLALEKAAGVETQDRPQRQRLSSKDIRTLSRAVR